MKKLLFLALPLTVLRTEAQKCDLDIKIPIYHVVYKEKDGERIRLEFNYNIYIDKYQSGTPTLIRKTDFGTFEARDMNCLGAMSFVLRDTLQNKQITGQFVNSPDTLKRLVTVIDPITDDDFKVIETYFEPLEDNTWVFRDFNLNISDTVHFDKGRKPGRWSAK